VLATLALLLLLGLTCSLVPIGRDQVLTQSLSASRGSLRPPKNFAARGQRGSGRGFSSTPRAHGVSIPCFVKMLLTLAFYWRLAAQEKAMKQ
jgi:hypothetical protein